MSSLEEFIDDGGVDDLPEALHKLILSPDIESAGLNEGLSMRKHSIPKRIDAVVFQRGSSQHNRSPLGNFVPQKMQRRSILPGRALSHSFGGTVGLVDHNNVRYFHDAFLRHKVP